MIEGPNMDEKPEATDKPIQRMSVKKKVIFAVIMVVGFFVLLDIAARIYDYARGVDPSTRLIGSVRIYRAHPYLNVALRPGAGGSNKIGFRGPEITIPKPAGRIRVVCLGGSTTYGHGLPAEAAYPDQLGEILAEKFPDCDIEVINAGVPTYCSLTSLISLQCRVLPLEPDIICVYHGANDMWPIMSPAFKPDYTHFYRDFPDDRTFDAAAGRGTFTKILECSRLFQGLRYKYTDYGRKRGIIYYTMHQPRDEWAKEPKVDEEGIKNFRRNLESIVAVARQHGVKVVLGTFAFRESIIPTPAQAECYKRMNKVVLEIGKSENVPVADIFPNVPDDAANYCNDDIHLTKQSSGMQAQAFADAIESAGLIEK